MITATWMSPADQEADWLLDVWPSAVGLTPESFALYTSAAQEQCLDYLGDKAKPEVKDSWRLAQALQARALMRAADTDSGDGIGPEGMTVTVFPMDWTVKRLLVPERRIGGIA